MTDSNEREPMIGFFDSEGGWVTRQGFEDKFGEQLDHPVEEVWSDLEEIGMLRVRRSEDGTPVTAQLSQFAVDLYELPDDADIGRVIGVYQEHGKEPPEGVREEYVESLRNRGGSA